MKKNLKFNALFLMLIFGFHISDCRDTTAQVVAKGCFGAAAVIGLVGAATAVANYLFQPTDQQQYDNTVALYNQLSTQYSELLDSFVSHFGIRGLSFYDKQRILNLSNEGFLNSVGWTVWTNGASVELFPSKVEQDALVLADHLSDLAKRVNKLKSKKYPSYEEVNLINMLDDFLGTVSHSSELLTLFAQYCKKHGAYFSISELGWSLFAQYEAELAIIERYRYDMYQLMHNLHDIVVNKQSTNYCGSDCRYPYIRYVESLDKNLARLDDMRNKLLYLYPIRIGWIDTVLIPQLGWLRTTLDPYYQSELLYQRRVQLDEEIQLLRHQKAMHEIARLENQRAQLEYEYGNVVNGLVISIH